MDLLYVSNKGTRIYHIKGFCHHIGSNNKINLASYKEFKTEQDVQSHIGQGNRLCFVCQQKRDKMLKEASK